MYAWLDIEGYLLHWPACQLPLLLTTLLLHIDLLTPIVPAKERYSWWSDLLEQTTTDLASEEKDARLIDCNKVRTYHKSYIQHYTFYTYHGSHQCKLNIASYTIPVWVTNTDRSLCLLLYRGMTSSTANLPFIKSFTLNIHVLKFCV